MTNTNRASSLVIRVALACAASFGLSQLWQALFPPLAAVALSFIGGLGLGVVAVMGRWPSAVPNPLPTYRVEVRAEDYEPQAPPTPPRHSGGPATARWDAPEIKNLRGVAWHDAEIPPRRHECWPQTDGWIRFEQVQRCACGAIRSNRYATWVERNSRTSELAS